MLKTISKKYNTLRQAERYQNLLYNKFDNVKLIKSPMFTEYGTYVWAVSGEINPRSKRNPQPKKKNAYSGAREKIITFHGNEIAHVAFIERGEGLAIIVTLTDGTKIHSGSYDIPTMNGKGIAGNKLIPYLVANYLD